MEGSGPFDNIYAHLSLLHTIVLCIERGFSIVTKTNKGFSALLCSLADFIRLLIFDKGWCAGDRPGDNLVFLFGNRDGKLNTLHIIYLFRGVAPKLVTKQDQLR